MSFPACQFLAQQGHTVEYACHPSFASIFECISYAKFVDPNVPHPHDRKLDFNIGLLDCKLQDYIYEKIPAIAPAKRRPVVFDVSVTPEDYGLPKDYILISPFGYCQPRKPSPEWFVHVVKNRIGGSLPIYALTDRPLPCPVPTITARRLSHLPALIRNATEFFTINSAPTVIAAAVRSRYYHVRLHDEGLNYDSDRQIVLHGI
jgi:hypothetical protein